MRGSNPEILLPPPPALDELLYLFCGYVETNEDGASTVYSAPYPTVPLAVAIIERMIPAPKTIEDVRRAVYPELEWIEMPWRAKNALQNGYMVWRTKRPVA